MKPVDEFGYPGAIGEDGEFDGGDTAAIMGTMAFFNGLLGAPNVPFNGTIPLRHPDYNKWYGQPDRFSRDQLLPWACVAVKYPKLWYSFLFYAAHRDGYFLTAWNTRGNGRIDAPKKLPDFTGPEVWALWIRYKRPKWARLVLGLLDLELLISAILWRYVRKDNVCRNHMLSSITCYKYMPTFVAKLACKINNWPDLLSRWKNHCEATREYDTSDLFVKAVKDLNL